MKLNTLEDWLNYIYTLHNKEIDLGLDRVKEIARRLNLLTSNCPTIIVGGTNGKGSTVKGLETIYQKANYRVGAFTTPFLMKHNEQVRVCGQLVNDSEFCSAFEKINQTRGDITLTIFEFNTLAALLIFKNHSLDLIILEVGLGGRLDAVNMIDANVSIVTSIALDHMDRLGDTREKIAFEKAGIFRSNQPAICGDMDPPNSLVNYANQINAPLYCQNDHFTYHEAKNHWTWQFGTTNYRDLPLTSLYLQNMSTALAAITLLQSTLPVDENSIRGGLSEVALIGRCEVIPGRVTIIYDVAHNPAAIFLLAKKLCDTIPTETNKTVGKTYALFSMLADKDIDSSIQVIKNKIDHWYVAPLLTNRAASKERLEAAFNMNQIQDVTVESSIDVALQSLAQLVKPDDCIVIFGSFHTVAEALKAREHISI